MTQLGFALSNWSADAKLTFQFLGEVQLAVMRLFRGKAMLRWTDLVWQIDQAGPRSLAIV